MARINRVIELLAAGQPVYTTGVAEISYEAGRAAATTFADYLTLDLEHDPFEPAALRRFMRGLLDAGPTRSGHRSPAVVVTLSTSGADEHVVRANAWMIKQALAAGVHGLLLCHAESAAAVRAFVEHARFAFQAASPGLGQGRRGAGGEAFAAEIWGLAKADYLACADPWPLNPDGELIFGLKIENPRADANVETSVRVPGIAFAEWGPGDHGFFIMGRPGTYKGGGEADPQMAAVRRRMLNATKAAGVKFLNACNEKNVIEQLKDGVMICTGGDSPAADIGRKFTNRTDPF